MLSEAEWTHHHQEGLPNEIDRTYVPSLMGRVPEAGQFAHWIAPPAVPSPCSHARWMDGDPLCIYAGSCR